MGKRGCRCRTAPAVVRAPEIVGRVLSTEAQIEAELFKGRSETVTIELDGKRLRLSNLNKVYFPESGHTKRNLLAYYTARRIHLALSTRSGFGFAALPRRNQGTGFLSKGFAGRRTGVVHNRAD